MKYTLIIAILLLVGGGFYIYSTTSSDREQTGTSSADDTYSTFTDSDTGLTFEYKTAPDGYVVDDLSAYIGVEDTSVLKVFRVMNAREKVELETGEGGREGPPTINIMVSENRNNQSASVWTDSVPQFSNIGLVLGDVDRDAVVGGANAVRYRTDGLYQADNVVIAHGGFIYHFTGSFLEENSPIHRDFETLINSVAFVPTEEQLGTPAAKIDPRVACESALIYMTFASGKEADAFVAACINGEHPEVIDRYVKDMGLDGAAI